MRVRVGFAGLLLLAALPLLGALGPRYGGRLAIGVLELPASLEPRDVLGRDEALILGLVHDTLLRVGDAGTASPALATRWASAAGGREWTLWLRGGLRFHDASPLTSADVVRSLRRFLRGPSPLAAVLAEGLEGGSAFRAGEAAELPALSAPDAERLVLRFREAGPFPLAPLASMAAAITSPGGAGAGPYVPNLRLAGRIALVPFGGHWAGRPFLDALDVIADSSPEGLAAGFGARRIDVLPGGSGVSALGSILLLQVDGARPPFDGPAARAALDRALERMELTRLLPGAVGTRTLLAPALLAPLPKPRPAIGAASFDAEIALAVERDVPPLVSQRLVALLSELGARVRVVPPSPGTAPAEGTELRLRAFSPQVPEAWLSLRELAARTGALPAIQDEMTAAERELDPDRRRVQLYRAENALRETGLVLPVGVAPVSVGVRVGAHGVRVDAGGRIRLDDAWVEP